MRLISQTGDIDIPYESSTIVRAGELIVAYSVNYYSSINYYSKKKLLWECIPQKKKPRKSWKCYTMVSTMR